MRSRFSSFWALFAITLLIAWQATAAEAPARAGSRPGSSQKATTSSPSATRQPKIDLNTATEQQLESLPGIGPATAASIIKARPFKSVNELSNVSGISQAKFSALKSQVSVKRSAGSNIGTSAQGEKSSATSRSSRSNATVTGGKVDLNTASKEQLETLPEIGPARAQAIIEARPFNSIEDVKRVKGIKEGIFDGIKDRITVRWWGSG